MSLLDYLRMGAEAAAVIVGFAGTIVVALVLVYLLALAGLAAHTALLGRRRDRLEPGVDRPYGIDYPPRERREDDPRA